MSKKVGSYQRDWGFSQSQSPNYAPVDPKQLFHIHCGVCVHVRGYNSSWYWQCLLHVKWGQHESRATFSHATSFDFLPRHLYLRQWEGDKVGDNWETSGKTHQATVEHDLILRQQEDTREERTETNTKQEWHHDEATNDTATKAYIWLETNDFGDRSSRRRMIGDKLYNRETDKLGDTWCETNDEKQVKAKKRHPQRRTPLDRVETNKGRQVKRHIQRAGHN